MSADTIHAPWTPKQVQNLNLYQEAGLFHPFTCGVETCRADLVATEAGWVCPACDYTQDWAHAFMVNGEMLTEAIRMMRTLSSPPPPATPEAPTPSDQPPAS